MSNADVSRDVQFIVTVADVGKVDTKIGTLLNSVGRGINVHMFSYYFLFKYVHCDEFRRDRKRWQTYHYKASSQFSFSRNLAHQSYFIFIYIGALGCKGFKTRISLK